MGRWTWRKILHCQVLLLIYLLLLWSTIEAQIRYTIPEELNQGSTVGNIAKDLGLGVSEISDRKLRIDSEGKQYFNVDLGRGELIVGERIDREDVVTDKDGMKVPVLVLERPLDREKQPMYRLILTAVDGGIPAKSGSADVTVHVLDINDNAPQFEKAVYELPVNENTPKGTVIGSVNAEDFDEGVNSDVVYSFGSGTPDMVKNIFSINPLTGEITLNSVIDYEETSSFKFDVRASDKGIPSMEGHCTVRVQVVDVNDNPPEIILKSMPSPVREDAPVGTVVALISTKDLDSGENGKVNLSVLSEYPFKLKPTFLNRYALVTISYLDREHFPEYNVEISATDSGSPPLVSKKVITVNILDVNDNPPNFSQTSYTVYVQENGAPGKIICSVSAYDPDLDLNAKISYSVLDTKAQDVLLVEIKDNGEPVQSTTVTVGILLEDGVTEPISDLRQRAHEPSKKNSKITFYLIISLASVSAVSFVTFVILTVKCVRNGRRGACCCVRTDSEGYKNPNRNLQIQLNTDGPIKYVEVLGGDMMSQSQSFRSCFSPVSEYSDFTFVKPSSTSDFKEMINVLDASLPDSTWTFESQQVSITP
ncbi:hypothetical protein JZ751_006884 [Albula glossodonta]|uniref:Cadherin domain-containing protein n=1 Tax=Albula glossodonta TaxID=121402 RepID=A0A8T2NZM7_9TELE|nr:hypothetical protein JZ751_006884 [Albula glossodonta]